MSSQCANCIDVRNVGKKFCKFCGQELSGDTVSAINLLDVQTDSLSSLFTPSDDPKLMEGVQKRQREVEELKKKEREQKRREEAERKREIEKKARQEFERVNGIKAKMTDVELLQYEMQEKVLEVLLVIASQNGKGSTSNLSFSSWFMGLTTLLDSEEE